VHFFGAHRYTRLNGFAKLRIAPLLAAVFLCAQLLATAHSAAYADVDHVHDGTPCIIAAASKHADSLDVAKPAPVLERALSHDVIPAIVHLSLIGVTASPTPIRGPPTTR